MYIIGGNELISSRGLGRLAPKWKGKRGDLITIGGEKPRESSNWSDSRREIFQSDRKKIVATMVEILTNVIMSTHVYSFCGHFFVQRNGGPIGLRSTESLASLVMKLWDQAWVNLLAREGISVIDYLRYVDDSRDFVRPLEEGIRWDGQNFSFSEVWRKEDFESGLSDESRTTREFIKAKSSILEFLQFEGEDSSMFTDSRLPTLDSAIWVTEYGLIAYTFYEKPMCPNKVLQKDTALSESCIWASLTQEVVRRLKNTKLDRPASEKQEILSAFSQKLINSGHSLSSCQYILVHGTVKYLELVRRSALPKSHKLYRPLFLTQDFDVRRRKLRKMLAKSSWFDDSELNSKINWRQALPQGWSGKKPVQFKVPAMKFSTTFKVPSTKGGRLLKMLSKAEPRIAKICGYQLKMVEGSGRPLSNMFSKTFTDGRCHRICALCVHFQQRRDQHDVR